jgi:hypothetical protein
MPPGAFGKTSAFDDLSSASGTGGQQLAKGIAYGKTIKGKAGTL